MTSSTTESLSELLRKYRARAGLTQEALALKARISARTISDLERGVYPTTKLSTAHQLADVLQLSQEERRGFETAARGAARPRLGLPAPVAPFIGRAAELAALHGLLLRRDVRLLTLVGPGGSGKTRLAIEAARAARRRFPNGMYLVSLASLADPRLVVQTIAHTLGVRESAGQRIEEGLVQWLVGKRALIILDNLEHLVAAGPAITFLLEQCPGLTVLATSRVHLRLSGEYLFPVPPMSVPADGAITRQELDHYDGTALFVERAHAFHPGLCIDDETTPLIAAICARLDGLPLAIELAAARTRSLSLSALLAEIETSTDRLGEGPRDAPARQRTLWDTMEWSYHLLSGSEQQLFARLSVFSGGCTLAAAQEVCGDGAIGDVRQAVEQLEQASLLTRTGGPEPRVEMLATIREFAAGRLRELGDEAAIGRRHAAYYVRLVEETRPELRGANQRTYLDRLDTEHNNLRSALAWLMAHEVNEALRFGRLLLEFWFFRGYWEEGARWLPALLERGAQAPVGLRGRAMHAWGWLQFYRGKYAEAVSLLAESAGLLKEAGDGVELAATLYHLGFVHLERGELTQADTCLRESLAWSRGPTTEGQRSITLGSLSGLARKRGDFEQALAFADQSLRLARKLGSQTHILAALNYLGVARLGLRDYAGAEMALREALTYCRELGIEHTGAVTLMNLGEVAWERGDFDQAEALYTQGLSECRALGDAFVSANTLGNLSKVALSRGDVAAAVERVRAALELSQELAHDKPTMGTNLTIGAAVLSAAGRARVAGTLWAASSRILAEAGYVLPIGEQALQERWMAHARSMVGEVEWNAAWAAGAEMAADRAVDIALEELSTVAFTK